MGKKNRQAVNSEFPLLDEVNLYASSTKGDGNCLFRALSDQVYGDESHHAEIRRKVVSYVEQHGEHFAAFVGEFGESFEQYVRRLYQDGVYGGHIELVGFAEVYSRQVAIYQAENMYVLDPQSVKPSDWGCVAHIAYHTWEHYSSVRPKAGPHSGPVAFPVPAVAEGGDSSETKSRDSSIPPWKVEIVLRSVPDAPEARIKEMLQTKELDTVIEELLMQEFEDEPESGEQQDQNQQQDQHEPQHDRPEPDTESTTAEAAPKSEVAESGRSKIEDKEAGTKKGSGRPKTTEGSEAAAATMLSKKQLAKERRQEKKDRARRRKTGAVEKTSGQTEDSNSNATGGSKKVIHI